jgi:hypothetical protein
MLWRRGDGEGVLLFSTTGDSRPTPDTLPLEFKELADGTDEQIREFAERFGPLGLCAHRVEPVSGPHVPLVEQGRVLLPATHAVASEPGPEPGRLTLSPGCLPIGRIGNLEEIHDATVNARRANPGADITAYLSPEPPTFALDGEPLDSWRFYAHSMRSLLLVAASLHQGEFPTAETWQEALAYSLSRPGPTYRDPGIFTRPGLWEPVRAGRKLVLDGPFWALNPRELDVERRFLARLVEDWVIVSRIYPVLVWGEPRPEFHADPRARVALYAPWPSLFAALAIHLAYAATSNPGLAECSYCREPYKPGRSPRPGEKNYCPRCRDAPELKKAKGREQRRAHRRKRREEEPPR